VKRREEDSEEKRRIERAPTHTRGWGFMRHKAGKY